eukprot:comp21010_c0_seq1/m.28204 comp21010_c0_seq1/g.28204  ORF comp21010_c0_seq1/g.28204 comp21010_c0_seq1/m.28204 type:complete len:499 (-) comp21010_c0_seq1:526-2022(-)
MMDTSAESQQGTKAQLWSRHRRLFNIAAAVILCAAIIATAIAVPVAVSQHNASSRANAIQQTSTLAPVSTSYVRSIPPAPKPTPTTTATLTPTQNASDPCTCLGVFSNGTCYTTLAEAVNATSDNGVLLLARNTTVTDEILLEKSISLVGATCKGLPKPIVYVDMDIGPSGCVFRLAAEHQTLALENLNFQRLDDSGYASVARSPELSDETTIEEMGKSKQRTTLSIKKCSFSNFQTKSRGGAVFFIDRTDNLTITDSSFSENRVKLTELLYDGSGAVFVRTLVKDGVGTVKNSQFSDNKHEFFHGLGAGMGFYEIFGDFSLQNVKFTNNRCSAGAGFYVDSIRPGASVDIDCDFEGNVAESLTGFPESRGGAMWLKNIQGSVYISGSFVGNQCPNDRGGAIANNRLDAGGSVTVDAYFEDNQSTKGASVWDTQQGFSNAKIRFESGCEFKGNTCHGCEADGMIIRLMRPVTGPGAFTSGSDIIVTDADWDGNKLVYT